MAESGDEYDGQLGGAVGSDSRRGSRTSNAPARVISGMGQQLLTQITSKVRVELLYELRGRMRTARQPAHIQLREWR